MAKRARKTAEKTAPEVQDRRSATIEQWAIGDLKPYNRNSRTHSPKQIDKLAKSIQRFGFTNPVLIGDDGIIIAGHGRILAAKQLGIETIPVIVAKDWTDEERRAYVITDNQTALEAGWDESLLKLELGELAEAGFDLELTGFDEKQLNDLFGTASSDDDNAAAPQLEGLTYSVVVRCTGERHQGELLEEFEGRNLKCEALIS